MIGLLAAIGPLSQLLQLPAILLVEKVRNRRMITVVAAAENVIVHLPQHPCQKSVHKARALRNREL